MKKHNEEVDKYNTEVDEHNKGVDEENDCFFKDSTGKIWSREDLDEMILTLKKFKEFLERVQYY